jgi:hypothetical protein
VRRLKELDPGAARNTDHFHSQLLDALRGYLGARLDLPPGALTFADVIGVLQQRGAAEETIAGLRALFEQCEAGRYAGGMQSGDEPSHMAERARQASGHLERDLR